MSNPLNAQDFMDRMRSFVSEKPDSLSMEIVSLCATMIEWSKGTQATVLTDFVSWIIELQTDKMFVGTDGVSEKLDDLARRAQEVMLG